MARFAQGKYALAISDISGQAFPWNEMVTQWNGLFVHFSEFESKQPQLDPKPSHADPTALPTTRPQQPPSNALRFLSFNPITSFAAGNSVINVFEQNHGRQHGSYVRFRGPPGIAGAFNNIAAIDGISGAQICDASGFKITPGIFTNTTTTLVSNIDATQTTGIILTSSTGFEINSPRTPGSVDFFSGGTPMNAIIIGGELIAYTGITNNILDGVVRGSFSSTATTHTAGVTIRCLQDPLNNYNTNTSDQGGSDTATTGQISGGGYNTSSGPVTLKTIGPQ
jgi:hypothetical protein